MLSAAKGLFEKTDSKPEDYDYACFHQPNGKFYLRAGKKLGFTSEQIKQGLLTPNIGNTYSGAVPLALSNILDVNEEIKEKRDLAPKTQDIIDRKQYVDYAVYAKFKGKIKM